jgi:hypothetical protein
MTAARAFDRAARLMPGRVLNFLEVRTNIHIYWMPYIYHCRITHTTQPPNQDGVTPNPDRKSKLGGTGPRPHHSAPGFGGGAIPGPPALPAVAKKQRRKQGQGQQQQQQGPQVCQLPLQPSRFRGVIPQAGGRWKALINLKGADYYLGYVHFGNIQSDFGLSTHTQPPPPQTPH